MNIEKTLKELIEKERYRYVHLIDATHYLKATQLPDNTTLHLVSEFAYHDMNKVASIGKLIYYCSGKRNAKINHQSKADEMVTFLEPPDDLCIDDADKLKIVTVGTQRKSAI